MMKSFGMSCQFFKDLVNNRPSVGVEAFDDGFPLFYSAPEDDPVRTNTQTEIVPEFSLKGTNVAQMFREAFIPNLRDCLKSPRMASREELGDVSTE